MDNNERLARFMGKGRYNDSQTFDFENNYNDLMALVDKIENTEFPNMGYIDFHIMPDAIIVNKQNDEENFYLIIDDVLYLETSTAFKFV